MWATVAGIVLVFYGLFYWFAPVASLSIPFSDYWDDKVGDVILLLAALSAAALGGKMTRNFTPSEPPHRVWFLFTLGWWSWVCGEALGFVYDYFYWFVDYPEVTFMDLFWTLGYIFIGLSLYYQFRLIYGFKLRQQFAVYGLVAGLGLLVSVGLTQWAIAAGLGEGYSWGAMYLAVLYPVFDLAAGLGALWLFFLFKRGWLGRPWWGLLAFAFADGFDSLGWMGGLNWMSDKLYDSASLISACIYLSAYMIAALAFLAADDHLALALQPDRPAST